LVKREYETESVVTALKLEETEENVYTLQTAGPVYGLGRPVAHSSCFEAIAGASFNRTEWYRLFRFMWLCFLGRILLRN
jgi:hypothetical protein